MSIEETIKRVREIDQAASRALVVEPRDEDGTSSVSSGGFEIADFSDESDALLFVEYRTLAPELADECERLNRGWREANGRALERGLECEQALGKVKELEEYVRYADRDKAQAGKAMELYARKRDEARAELEAISENFNEDTEDLVKAVARQTKDFDEVSDWWDCAKEALCLLPGMAWDEKDCESLVPNAKRCIGDLVADAYNKGCRTHEDEDDRESEHD